MDVHTRKLLSTLLADTCNTVLDRMENKGDVMCNHTCAIIINLSKDMADEIGVTSPYHKSIDIRITLKGEE